MYTIQKATINNLRSITTSLRNCRISYNTPQHAIADILAERLYIVIENGKPIAQCAIVYDNTYNYYAMKRLIIYNKKNYNRGIGSALFEFFKTKNYPALGITPWQDNTTMIYLAEKHGFVWQYNFLDNFSFYLLTNK